MKSRKIKKSKDNFILLFSIPLFFLGYKVLNTTYSSLVCRGKKKKKRWIHNDKLYSPHFPFSPFVLSYFVFHPTKGSVKGLPSGRDRDSDSENVYFVFRLDKNEPTDIYVDKCVGVGQVGSQRAAVEFEKCSR